MKTSPSWARKWSPRPWKPTVSQHKGPKEENNKTYNNKNGKDQRQGQSIKGSQREKKRSPTKEKPSGYHQTSQQKPYRPEENGMIYLMQ